MNVLDIRQLREDTPGCRHVLHLNNAGAALMPRVVTEAVKSHLDCESRMGGYEAARETAATIEQFYQHVAQLIHCDADEVAFMDNATRAWDMAFYSFRFVPGDKILTAVSEYASNYLAFLHQAKHTGVEIVLIENDESGQLDLQDLERKIDKRVRLIAITHVPTQGGLINPVEEVGKIAKAYRIPYLLDATQSVGQMPIDVKKISCDFLCATGRKYLRGPRGTGFLYAGSSIVEQCDPPFIDLYAANWVADNAYVLSPKARRFETWEQNIAAKIGLGVAIQYAVSLGIPAIWQRIQQLAERLRQGLSSIPGVKLQDSGKNPCGIVTFSSAQKTSEDIQHYLLDRHINVSVSFPEYARLDLLKRKAPSLVRASVHYYNTESEMEIFCSEIERYLKLDLSHF